MTRDLWGADIVVGAVVNWQTANGSIGQGLAVPCRQVGCTTYRDTGAGCRALHLVDGAGTRLANLTPECWVYDPALFPATWQETRTA